MNYQDLFSLKTSIITKADDIRRSQVLTFYVKRLPSMKYQDLFSLKNKKKKKKKKKKIQIVECRLLQILLGALRVEILYAERMHSCPV